MIEEMRKKRDELAEVSINRNFFELHEADARVRAFKAGWDACAEESEQLIKFVKWIQAEQPYLSGSILSEMASRALQGDETWKYVNRE